ncbi:MAG: phosphatase PAP2 family protein [Xanthomonadaceae bacterium]|nr:phosphatase PAP2 family protein [Xanthomonadaceae bacterium]
MLKIFKITPHLKRRDLWLTVIPALVWLTAFNARHLTLNTFCADTPHVCISSNLSWPDSEVVTYWSPLADWYSNWTQYSAGILAASAPAIWAGAQVAMHVINPGAAIAMWTTDALLIIQATFWNGAINEVIKIGVNRPRPFVYRNPASEGKVHHSYSSFYSGHTSFAAVATIGLIASLFARNAPIWMTLLFGFSGLTLTIVTGALRVAAGVHFYSDVVFGLFAGILISYLVQKRHRIIT